MIRKNLTLCCTLSATTVVAAGLLAGSALGSGNAQTSADGAKGPDKSSIGLGAQRITRIETKQKLTHRAKSSLQEPAFTPVSFEALRDLGMKDVPRPQFNANQTSARSARRSASAEMRGAFINNPTGQTYSIASSAAGAFGPVLFGILDYSDPSSGNPHPGGLDDIFTIGAPNPEDGRGYVDLTQPSTPPVDYPVVTESIIAYNGGAGTATFRSQRRMSGWDGAFPPGNGFFQDALYPGYAVGGIPVDSTILMIGHEDLLAWEPQSRVVSGNLGLRSDESGGFVLFTGLEDAVAAPFHGPDGIALNPFFSQFFIGGEQVTMDIVANNGPYTDPPCPNDIVPNDGSGAYAGRIGNGAVSIADINAVVTSFNIALGPPRPIGDVAPAGGNWAVSIADINSVVTSFNLPCPVYTNNNCAGAITVLEGTTEFSNVNATTDGPDHGSGLCDFFGSGHIVNDVWFEYTPTCAPGQGKAVVVDTLGSSWDTKVAIYDAAGGCPTDATNLLACNDDWAANPLTYRSVAVAENLVDGTTLLIRVGGSPVAIGGTGNTAAPPPLPGSPLDGYNGTTGYEGFLTIQCFVQDPDNCVDALELVVDGPVVRFDNSATTNESPSPPATCGSDALSNNNGGPQQAGGGSRWYTVNSPVDRRITITTDFDTEAGTPDGLYPALYYPVEIHVYCRTCASPLCVASQANSNGSLGGTTLTFCAEGGRDYLVAVWGGPPSAPNGDPDCCAFYDMQVTSAAPAGCVPVTCADSNDLCADAIDVTSSVTVNGSGGAPVANSNEFASPDAGTDDAELPAGSPTCHWNGEPDSVHHTDWYKFTAANLGAFDTTTISLCSSAGTLNDSVIMVFSGTCGSLVEVGCGEDECGGPTWFSTAIVNNLNDGQVYYFCIGASGGTGGVEVPGDYTFTITQDTTVAPPTCDEDFEPIIAWPPAAATAVGANVTLGTGSWHVRNRSTTTGTTAVFQGNTGVFPAHVNTGYAGMNFNATTATNTISLWLICPTLLMSDGNEVSFWTRTPTASAFPDRIEVRMSTNGASVNLGASGGATGSTQVGDYTNLLTSVNPTLTAGGYPEVWTEVSSILAGVGASNDGRIAIRYFVTSGGPTGANSNYIGIDCWSWDGSFAP